MNPGHAAILDADIARRPLGRAGNRDSMDRSDTAMPTTENGERFSLI